MKTRPVPARKSAQEPDSVVLTLRTPLGNLRQLTVKRPTAAELRPMPMRVFRPEGDRAVGATWGDTLGLLSRCSGVDLDVLRSMRSQDLVAGSEVLNRWLHMDIRGALAARRRERGDGVTVLKLARPLKLGTETLEALELKQCQAEHLMDMHVDASIGDLLELGGRLSLQADVILDRLDVEDALPLVALVSDFFGASPETGE